jgi:hypothetical protein
MFTEDYDAAEEWAGGLWDEEEAGIGASDLGPYGDDSEDDEDYDDGDYDDVGEGEP